MYYLNEVKRGLSGSGQYHLKDKYQFLKADYYAFHCVKIDLPEDIIKNMRERRSLETTLKSVKSGQNGKELHLMILDRMSTSHPH